MSCLPGMPCFGNHPNNPSPINCGIDPCNSRKSNTDSIKYNGPNLPCIDVNTCETLTVILQKIDNSLCGVNLSQTIINTIINNTFINQQFTTIINNSVSCDTILNCLTTTTTSSTSSTSTSTTTTTTTACVCNTYAVTNPNYNYPISTTFLDCDGNTVTISVSDTPVIICACEGSIDPQSLLVFTVITSGCVPVPNLPNCAIFMNNKDQGVTAYDPLTGVSTQLYIPGWLGSEDIATTDTKLWLYQDSGGDTSIYEWDITLAPFTATFNRTINVPGFSFGPGLTAKDNYTLITSEDTTGDMYEIDIITNTGIPSYLFSMIPNRVVTGDIVYTTTQKLIITNNNPLDYTNYMTQYDYITGNLEVDIDLNFYAGDATALFEYNGEIYAGFCDGTDTVNSYVMNFDKNYPYSWLNYSLLGYCPNGASSNPLCNDGNFNTTTTTTTAAIPCFCYQMVTEDPMDPGNYELEWVNCDGTPGGPVTVNNSVFSFCAQEDNFTLVSGSGFYVVTPNGPCSTNTDCWQSFNIQLQNAPKFNISRIEFTSPIIINWGDGNTEYVTTSPYICNPGGPCEHNYLAVGGYTGNVTISCSDLGNIKHLRLQNCFGTAPTGNEVATLVGSEIIKLNKLEYLHSITSILNCAVTDLSPTLLLLSARGGIVSGDIASLPSTLQTIQLVNNGDVVNHNTLTGDITNFPNTLLTISIAGDNTIYGNITAFPGTFPTQLKEISIAGLNTIDGDITGVFAGYTSQFKRISIGGRNTIYGTLNGTFPNSMDYISLTGWSYPDGTTAAFTSITGLRYLILDTWESDPMLPASAGNSISGDIANLPNSLIFTNIAGSNTISGDIIDMPAGTSSTGTFFRLAGRVWGTHVTGGNTVTGDVADIRTNCKFFALGGNNTLYGNIQNMPVGVIERFVYNSPFSSLTGNIWGVPNTLKTLSVTGNHSVHVYQPSVPYPTLVPTKSWPTGLNYIQINPTNPAMDLSVNDTDQFLIDVAAVTWAISGGYPSKAIELQSAGRTAFSDAAYNSLIAQGVSVSIIPS